MCRDYEITFPRLNGDIPDRGCRYALGPLEPVVAAVQRHEKAEHRAEKQQIWIDRVLLDTVGVPPQILPSEACPFSSVAFDPVHVGGRFTTAVIVEHNMGD